MPIVIETAVPLYVLRCYSDAVLISTRDCPQPVILPADFARALAADLIKYADGVEEAAK